MSERAFRFSDDGGNPDSGWPINVCIVLITAVLLMLAFSMTLPGCVEGPDDGTEPIPGGEVKVMILYESADNHSSEQLSVIHSTKLRKWLKDKSIEFRVFDKDADMSEASATWKGLMANAKTSVKAQGLPLPVLIVFHDGKGKVYALPESDDAVIEIFGKRK